MTVDKGIVNKDDYYTTEQMEELFLKNGIKVSKYCSNFINAISKYDKELLEKIRIRAFNESIRRNIYLYSKEFVDRIDFNYLKKLQQNNTNATFLAVLRYQFGNKTPEGYYITEEVNDIFVKNGMGRNCKVFVNSLRIYYPDLFEKVIKKKGKINLYSKDFIDSIDFEFLHMLSEYGCEDIYGTLIDYQVYGQIRSSQACKVFGCSLGNFLRIAYEESDIITTLTDIKRGECSHKYIKIEEFFKWKKFKDSVIGLQSLAEKAIKEIDESIRGNRVYYYHRLLEIYTKGQLDKFGVVPEKNTPFRTKNQNEFYIKKEYKNDAYKLIKDEFLKKTVYAFGSKVDKFNLEFGSINTKKRKNSFKYFYEFAISRISSLVKPAINSYIDIARNIEKLDKEIMKCTTEDVENIVNTLQTKEAKNEFVKFLKDLKLKETVKYSKVSYNLQHNKEDLNNRSAYTQEQYLRFGFLVWSDSHIWYESYLEKALDKRVYACVWLYTALHYICAWRASDLIEQFPIPDIHMSPKEFLEKVKNKALDDKIAIDIIEQVNLKIDIDVLKPNKSRNVVNQPNLVLKIPESVYIFLGTLIGIVTAHHELSNGSKKQRLIINTCKRRSVQVEFFGEEYIDIFGEDSFSNIRAVKNYDMLVNRKGDKNKLGTGYVLASIARSHKFTVDKLSETTKIYLRYYKDMEDSEVLVRELFERGVCSFAPYLLTKIVAGEDFMMKLSPAERTDKIKEVSTLDAYDTEMILNGFEGSLNRAKRVVGQIIQDAYKNGLEPKEMARKVLTNLSYDEAPAKQEKFSCILIAQDKTCIYPKRKDCIGCGYEVYVKSCLSELGKRIKIAQEQAISSKTQNSRNKNILMIKDVFVPITKEILTTLKDVYKVENIDEYKKFITIKGDDK